jgi:hypothetical protein
MAGTAPGRREGEMTVPSQALKPSGLETTARELAIALWGQEFDKLPENTKADIRRQAREIEAKKWIATARGEDDRRLF